MLVGDAGRDEVVAVCGGAVVRRKPRHPMVQLLALVTRGTCTIIAAVFRTHRAGEIGCAQQLLGRPAQG